MRTLRITRIVLMLASLSAGDEGNVMLIDVPSIGRSELFDAGFGRYPGVGWHPDGL